MARVQASRFKPEPHSLASAYLLAGSDSVAVAESLRALVHASVGDEGADVEKLDGEPGVSARVREAAAVPPLFSDRRLVVVRRACRLTLDEAKHLLSALQSVPNHACIAVAVDPDPGADPSALERYASVERTLKEAIEAFGVVVDCSPPQAAKGPERLVELAAERSARLSTQAAKLLWTLCAQDFAEARAYLDKLADYAFGGEIFEEDIRKLVTEKRRAQVFAFADAVTKGELGTALEHLDVLLASRNRPEEAALQSVLPQLSRQYRLLWQARALLDRRIPPEKWGEHVKDPELLKEHNLSSLVSRTPGLAHKYARFARPLKLCDLAWALSRIAEAEAAMKGIGNGASPSDILGRLVIDLCSLHKETVSR